MVGKWLSQFEKAFLGGIFRSTCMFDSAGFQGNFQGVFFELWTKNSYQKVFSVLFVRVWSFCEFFVFIVVGTSFFI